ncbi:hypothetical protein D9M71_188790 [compost metagenome]
MLDVALEVPLAALGVAGFLQRHHPRAARIEMFHEALDGAALARRVTTFEQHDDALPGFLDPVLHLEQFHLQLLLELLVLLALQACAVRVAGRQFRRGGVLVAAVRRQRHLAGYGAVADPADFLTARIERLLGLRLDGRFDKCGGIDAFGLGHGILLYG